jgi:hypothetical protein
VAFDRHGIVAAQRLGDLEPVDHRRGIEDEGTATLGIGLLGEQRPTDVGVVDDLHQRLPAASPGQRDQLAPLLATHRVIAGIEVPAGQGGDRLEADHHPDVGDDLEHLPDAVVRVAEESPHRRLAVAEDELAGRGAEDAHLVLDVGGDHPVGTEQLPGLRVEQLRGNDEQRQTLGPRAALPLDALRAGQDAVDDVLGRIVRGPGDEALGPREVPVPSSVRAARVRPSPRRSRRRAR